MAPLRRTRTFRPVVLKRVPLGSLREEFLIPGRKFVPGRNWGGKALDVKTLSFYYLFIQHRKLHSEISLDGNVYSTQGQAALTVVTAVVKVFVWWFIINRLLFLHSR